MLVMHSFMI
uniref:Uncharacterized protein n=1 Tax=Arundo donax TaxID=35708 RepID=A0A0A9BET2_ARUDO